MIHSLKSLNIILITLLVVMLFTYTIFAVSIVRSEYSVVDIVEKLSLLKKESSELSLRLNEVSSLDYILLESNRLSYIEIVNVSYIEKYSTSPFASR